MTMNLPIVKLEVEGMRHTMAIALSQYTVQFDEILQSAINNFCTPENLEHIINNEVSKVLDLVIREEVKHWFVHGKGRKVIKEAVEKRLQNGTTWTPLDLD